MKIALATELRVDRKIAWSGTTRYMGEALRAAGAEVEVLEPIMEPLTLTLNALGKSMRRVTGTDPMFNRSRTVSRLKAAALQKQLKGKSFDAVFAPVGSTLIAEMPPGVPIIYSSDATLPLMQNYYARFGTSDSYAVPRVLASERAALHRADLLLYPTWWAANSAIRDFGVDPGRILVKAFGANLSDPPDRATALEPRRPGPLRLLFCGVEWLRKGGDIAVDALRALRASGVDAELTILGIVPPAGALSDPGLDEAVEVIPFLNKSVPAERARFREIFLDADILILPTQAECYGMVFCEAAACGTVSFATATGGVPEVILDGETGRVLPPGSTGSDYAAAIAEVARDPERLQQLKQAARADFDARLNWGVWGADVLERTREMLDARRRAPERIADDTQAAKIFVSRTDRRSATEEI